MQIAGFEKLSLVDLDGYMSCTLFTNGCNFKCPFCQNGLLATGKATAFYDEEEIIKYLESRKSILEVVCITGGEPTLHKDLKDLIIRIKNLGYKVKLDTNGTNLTMLKELVDLKLVDYVAVDVKNSLEKYNLTAGAKVNLDEVIKTIKYLLENHVDYEFRTTVIKEFMEFEDFVKIKDLIKGAKRYYLQKYVANDGCLDSSLHSYEKEDIDKVVELFKDSVGIVKTRGF